MGHTGNICTRISFGARKVHGSRQECSSSLCTKSQADRTNRALSSFLVRVEVVLMLNYQFGLSDVAIVSL